MEEVCSLNQREMKLPLSQFDSRTPAENGSNVSPSDHFSPVINETLCFKSADVCHFHASYADGDGLTLSSTA